MGADIGEIPLWAPIAGIAFLVGVILAFWGLGWWSVTLLSDALLTVLVGALVTLLGWMLYRLLRKPRWSDVHWSSGKLTEHYNQYKDRVLKPLAVLSTRPKSPSFFYYRGESPPWYEQLQVSYDSVAAVTHESDLDTFSQHLSVDIPAYADDFRYLGVEADAVSQAVVDFRAHLNSEIKLSLNSIGHALTDEGPPPDGSSFIAFSTTSKLLTQRWLEEGLPHHQLMRHGRAASPQWSPFRKHINPQVRANGVLVAGSNIVGRFDPASGLDDWFRLMDSLLAREDLFHQFVGVVQRRRALDEKVTYLQGVLRGIIAKIETLQYHRFLPCCKEVTKVSPSQIESK